MISKNCIAGKNVGAHKVKGLASARPLFCLSKFRNVSSTALEQLFPGQYHDAETGLNYNYFRSYNPGTGRYTQSDPIGVAGGMATYSYASGNPQRRFDPFGLEPWDWDGTGDTSMCSYYDNMYSTTKCSYYKNAAATCRGNNPAVNAILKLGITQAWTLGQLDDSQSEVTEKLREKLIIYDRISRMLNNKSSETCSCLRGDLIDMYHNMAFKDVGISTFWYGGNQWPQGISPNYVPYDPIGNSDYDPRRLSDPNSACDCQ